MHVCLSVCLSVCLCLSDNFWHHLIIFMYKVYIIVLLKKEKYINSYTKHFLFALCLAKTAHTFPKLPCFCFVSGSPAKLFWFIPLYLPNKELIYITLHWCNEHNVSELQMRNLGCAQGSCVRVALVNSGD